MLEKLSTCLFMSFYYEICSNRAFLSIWVFPMTVVLGMECNEFPDMLNELGFEKSLHSFLKQSRKCHPRLISRPHVIDNFYKKRKLFCKLSSFKSNVYLLQFSITLIGKNNFSSILPPSKLYTYLSRRLWSSFKHAGW